MVRPPSGMHIYSVDREMGLGEEGRKNEAAAVVVVGGGGGITRGRDP